MKKLLLLLLLYSFFIPARAQRERGFDKITMKNNRVFEAKVFAVDSLEVRYKYGGNSDTDVFTVKTADVFKIDFEDGHTQLFTDHIDAGFYAEHKRMAIKTGLLNPLTCNTAFSFERLIKPGLSWEVCVGLIGLGYDRLWQLPRGAYIKAGFRFIKKPHLKKGKLPRNWHVMQGLYFKPELTTGKYRAYDNGYIQGKENVTYAAVNLVFGYQYVFHNSFLLDGYLGGGSGTSSSAGGREPYVDYGSVIVDHIALTAGIKFGMLIN